MLALKTLEGLIEGQKKLLPGIILVDDIIEPLSSYERRPTFKVVLQKPFGRHPSYPLDSCGQKIREGQPPGFNTLNGNRTTPNPFGQLSLSNFKNVPTSTGKIVT